MMEDNNESSRRNFVRQLGKYTLCREAKARECVEMFQKEYDAQVECLRERLETMPNAKSLQYKILGIYVTLS